MTKALNQAHRQNEIADAIDPEKTAFELNSILLGAQWSLLMMHKDYMNARSASLAKFQSLATKEIPRSRV